MLIELAFPSRSRARIPEKIEVFERGERNGASTERKIKRKRIERGILPREVQAR